MIVFADGLAADAKQAPMLHGLIETMLKSPYRGRQQYWLCLGHMTEVGVLFITQ